MDISIIITTWNAESFLVEALDSILQQNYKHYEIIIVDDGSEDKTKEILYCYRETYTNIKMKIYEMKRIGRAKALIYAIENCNFDWIAILDADDLWHQDKLAIQVECIKRFNLSFLASRSKVFIGNVEINDLISKIHEQKSIKKVSLNEMLLRNCISHSSVLFKKNLAKYDSRRLRQIDYELWLRLLQSGQSIHFLDTELTFHRLHNKQSFEENQRLVYSLGSIILQLKYSLKNLLLLRALLCVPKCVYYLFVSRGLKMFLNEHVWDKLLGRP